MKGKRRLLIGFLVATSVFACSRPASADKGAANSVEHGWELYRNGQFLQLGALANKRIQAADRKASWYELKALAEDGATFNMAGTAAADTAAKACQMEPRNPHFLATYA